MVKSSIQRRMRSVVSHGKKFVRAQVSTARKRTNSEAKKVLSALQKYAKSKISRARKYTKSRLHSIQNKVTKSNIRRVAHFGYVGALKQLSSARKLSKAKVLQLVDHICQKRAETKQ